MGCGKTEAALAAAYQLIVSGKATGSFFNEVTQPCTDPDGGPFNSIVQLPFRIAS